MFKTFGKPDHFPSPALTCSPLISLIRADTVECVSVAFCATAAQSQLPSRPVWGIRLLAHVGDQCFNTPCGQEDLFVHSSFPSELPFRLSRRYPVVWKACEISRKGPESSNNEVGLLVTCALQKVLRWPCMVAIPRDLFPMSEATIEFRPCG